MKANAPFDVESVHRESRKRVVETAGMSDEEISKVKTMLGNSEYFHVFKRGKLTVIGFEAQHLTESTESLHHCQDMLLEVIDKNHCQILAVDLVDIGLVSSWILAVLAAAHRKGIEVHLYHPSRDIKDVLQITHLDELLRVRGDVTVS